MCGIIGILGKSDVAPLLLDGLKRLEYRGYDSAGIATLVDGRIERRSGAAARLSASCRSETDQGHRRETEHAQSAIPIHLAPPSASVCATFVAYYAPR